jgi:diguanylate cyclase (GGDEF)-like protein
LGDRGAGSRAAAMRAETTREREAVSALRDNTGDHRDLSARRRDELSLLRDEIARQRDDESARIDASDEVSDRHTLRLEELRARARTTRIRAASDRERAARDRAQAARDREQAANDREQAAFDREQAGTDELTGARRRGVGLEELQNEIKRARRENTSLVVAYVDVDGLKAVNDADGHAAGDKVLRNVAQGLRRHMRSYDLLVRMGGDEFLCALPDVSANEASARFGDLSQDLNGSTGKSVSIGFSELRESDSADALVQRADSDLLSRRGHSPRPSLSS